MTNNDNENAVAVATSNEGWIVTDLTRAVVYAADREGLEHVTKEIVARELEQLSLSLELDHGETLGKWIGKLPAVVEKINELFPELAPSPTQFTRDIAEKFPPSEIDDPSEPIFKILAEPHNSIEDFLDAINFETYEEKNLKFDKVRFTGVVASGDSEFKVRTDVISPGSIMDNWHDKKYHCSASMIVEL